MIPQLQLALAVLIYIISFLLALGIALAAFLLPRFLREAKKESEEFEERSKRFDEEWERRNRTAQLPRRLSLDYKGNAADAERLARETARRLQKGGTP